MIGCILLSGCAYKSQFIQKNTKSESTEHNLVHDHKEGDKCEYQVIPPLEGVIEVTLNEVKKFDKFDDIGIDKEECIIPDEVLNNPNRYCFLRLELSIYNKSAQLMNGYQDSLPFMINDFFMVTEIDDNNSELGKYLTEIIYFSGHPKVYETNYYHYNVDIGETSNFEIVYAVPVIDYENNNIWLCIGPQRDNFFEVCK